MKSNGGRRRTDQGECAPSHQRTTPSEEACFGTKRHPLTVLMLIARSLFDIKVAFMMMKVIVRHSFSRQKVPRARDYWSCCCCCCCSFFLLDLSHSSRGQHCAKSTALLWEEMRKSVAGRKSVARSPRRKRKEIIEQEWRILLPGAKVTHDRYGGRRGWGE